MIDIRKFHNIHFWLVVLNALSVFLILQIVFGLFPLWECDWPSDKIERVNSLVVDLAVGVITSTFFYYLLVYLGEWKRSKSVRRVIQWRLDAMAQNMQIVIGYYVVKYNIKCEDYKYLKIQPEAFKQVGNLTREKIDYWYRWDNSECAMNVCGSTERGFICNYIDLVKHHADRIMESTVFSLEDTKLIELVDRIDRCGLVNHIGMLNHNPKLNVNLGDYGNALMNFYLFYCSLASYVKISDLMPKEEGCKLGIPVVCN